VKRVGTIAMLALFAASCGGGGTTLYTKTATAACLAKAGRAVRPVGDDFVASSATGGSFRLRFPDNSVTVSFGETVDDAQNLDEAYRHFRAQNVGINDILRVQQNAVMLWKVHPQDADIAVLTGCLRG
jgi:hypothetical protein